jgi:hypothetical protein
MESIKGKNILIAASHTVFQDPPSRQAMASLSAEGSCISVIHGDQSYHVGNRPCFPVNEYQVGYPTNFPNRLRGIVYALRYSRLLRRATMELRPDLFVSMTPLPLALAPRNMLGTRPLRVGAVLDVMPTRGNGAFEDLIHHIYWKRLANCSVVWASDATRATEAISRTSRRVPISISHNVPPLCYLDALSAPGVDELSAVAKIPRHKLVDSSSVMVRAGAIGRDSYLEETIAAMRSAPSDSILLALGQPSQDYCDLLQRVSRECGVSDRVAIISRPSELVWRQALAVSQIGHMLTQKPCGGYALEKWILNPPTSNNRLFQYLAAGLTIFAPSESRLRLLMGERSWIKTFPMTSISPDTIAEEWRRVGASRELRPQAKHAGRTLFRREFNWENQFEPVLKRIREVVAKLG